MPSKETYGKLGEAHLFPGDVMQYDSWGKGIPPFSSKPEMKDTQTVPLTDELVIQAASIAREYQLKLSSAVKGTHYRGEGEGREPYEVLVLRYINKDKSEAHLGGTHSSIAFDVTNPNRLRVLGVANIAKPSADSQRVTHKKALETAILYLKKYAPDLLPSDVAPAALTDLPVGAYMAFSQQDQDKILDGSPLKVLWIGEHTEPYVSSEEGNPRESVVGMKVKMCHTTEDGSEEWLWVIVGDDGKCMMFEREISWSFENKMRLSQMPLHDSSIAVSKLLSSKLLAAACSRYVSRQSANTDTEDKDAFTVNSQHISVGVGLVAALWAVSRCTGAKFSNLLWNTALAGLFATWAMSSPDMYHPANKVRHLVAAALPKMPGLFGGNSGHPQDRGVDEVRSQEYLHAF